MTVLIIVLIYNAQIYLQGMTNNVKFISSVGGKYHTGGLQLVLPSKTHKIGDTKGHFTHGTESL